MKKIKRISVILVALAIMICTSLFATKDVNAATKAPKFENSKISVFLVNPDHSYFYSLDIKNLASDAKVTKVKSGNKKVLTVEYTDGKDYIKINPVKTGKAVVSCTIKQNGKTYKIKKTVKVFKGNPYKNVKINGKQVYTNGHSFVDYHSSKKNVKVSFKLNSGWKLKRMYYNYHNFNGKLITKNYNIKNGDKVKINHNGSHTSIKIDAVNKNGEIFRYLICVYYDPDVTDYFFAPAESKKVFLEGIK